MLCRLRYLALAVTLLGVVSVLGACGSSGPSDQQQVRTTLRQFGQAVAARDYHTVCTRLLAPSLTQALAQIGLPCETGLAKGFGQAQNPTLTVLSVKVKGNSASAVVHTTAANQPPSEDTIGLAKSHGTWQIAALAAAPAGAAGATGATGASGATGATR